MKESDARRIVDTIWRLERLEVAMDRVNRMTKEDMGFVFESPLELLRDAIFSELLDTGELFLTAERLAASLRRELDDAGVVLDVKQKDTQ